MVNQSPVHVESRENGWAVVREGSGRAVSLHPTQAEAAEEGRELARRAGTEFYLHAQDGRVREHRNYGEEPSAGESDEQGLVDGTVGQVTEGVGAAVRAVGAAVGPGGQGATDREEPRMEDAPGGDSSVSEDRTEEAGGLRETQRDDVLGGSVERYADYEVYDPTGERIGPPQDIFVDEDDDPEYLGVGTDATGARSALIPVEAVAVDDRLRRITVSRPRSVVVAGPSLGRDDEVTSQFEQRVRAHYGLETRSAAEPREGYNTLPNDVGLEDTSEPGVPEDELRVRRSEEEIRVQTREHEVGAVRLRKRVRTERERVVVPKKRVEVTVERVPVEGETVSTTTGGYEPQIGEEEIVVPIVEEEVVVEKRPVVKEEIRISKRVVEETEVVEEDVRREEVELDDQTGHRPAPEEDSDEETRRGRGPGAV